MAVIAGNGQTAIDIALQECGAIEAVIGVCLATDVNAYDAIGTGNVAIAGQVINSAVVKQFSDDNRKPASAYTGSAEPEGIDYWAIEDDFIVT